MSYLIRCVGSIFCLLSVEHFRLQQTSHQIRYQLLSFTKPDGLVVHHQRRYFPSPGFHALLSAGRSLARLADEYLASALMNCPCKPLCCGHSLACMACNNRRDHTDYQWLAAFFGQKTVAIWDFSSEGVGRCQSGVRTSEACVRVGSIHTAFPKP